MPLDRIALAELFWHSPLLKQTISIGSSICRGSWKMAHGKTQCQHESSADLKLTLPLRYQTLQPEEFL